MTSRRRRSLLEDDDFAVVGKNESSSGDVCERCGHRRDQHGEEGLEACACGKCPKFTDGLEE